MSRSRKFKRTQDEYCLIKIVHDDVSFQFCHVLDFFLAEILLMSQ